MTRSVLALSAAAIAFGGAALAQDFSNAQRVVIEDAIAGVTIKPSRDGTIRVSGAQADEMSLRVAESGGTVRIAGPEEIDQEQFWDDYGGGARVRIGPVRFGGWSRSVSIEDGRDARFDEMLEDYPDLTIELPEGTDLRFAGSALRLDSPVTLGRVEADGNIYLVAALGDADSAALRLSGVGRLALGDVTELMDAELSGSGDILFGNAGSAILTLSGSGDIEGEDVAGDAAMSLRGSGDIEAGRVGGAAEMVLRGSGDLSADEVAGRLEAQLYGSGDIEVDRVSGPVEVSLRGSGDIEIADGRAPRFEATLSGSGDIEFGGLAVDPKLKASGSGDIVVARSEGTVEASGKGIRVAGRSYDED